MWKSTTCHVLMARAVHVARPVAISRYGDAFMAKKSALTSFNQIEVPAIPDEPDDVELGARPDGLRSLVGWAKAHHAERGVGTDRRAPLPTLSDLAVSPRGQSRPTLVRQIIGRGRRLCPPYPLSREAGSRRWRARFSVPKKTSAVGPRRSSRFVCFERSLHSCVMFLPVARFVRS